MNVMVIRVHKEDSGCYKAELGIQSREYICTRGRSPYEALDLLIVNMKAMAENGDPMIRYGNTIDLNYEWKREDDNG